MKFLSITLFVLLPAITRAQVIITPHPERSFQVMENFSASDAWAAQFTGHWPEAKKNEMADWLFSLDTLSDGSPKGIGLSLWRMNLGAGSAEQGEAGGIKDEWHRAEYFLDENGSLDLSKQAGQQWWLAAAKARGVQQFLGFFNAPPVIFSRNHRAFADSGRSNLDSTKTGAFAEYISLVLPALEKKWGIRFNYLSPVNEPQWDWSDSKQEGNPYTNAQIAALVTAIDKSFREHRIATKQIIPEAGHLKYLLGDSGRSGRGQQINDFFGNKATGRFTGIGQLFSVEKVVAAHSYFSTAPYAKAIDYRLQVAEKIAKIKNLRYWQSEYCILGDNEGEINGSGKDTGMTAALYVSKVMHADLVFGNATAWHWWLAISPYNYKDGLIYIEKNKTDGQYSDSKILWVMGNYSRFISPGTKRMFVTVSEPRDHFLVSAWKNRNHHILVMTNGSDQPLQVQVPVEAPSFTLYTTSENQKLQKSITTNHFTLPARSVCTLVYRP